MVTDSGAGRRSLRRRVSTKHQLGNSPASHHSDEPGLARHRRRTEELSRTENKVRVRDVHAYTYFVFLPKSTLASSESGRSRRDGLRPRLELSFE